MARKTTMQVIQENKGKINPHYEICVSDMLEIKNHASDIYSIMTNAFIFGYVKGQRAEKARRNTNGKVH